MFEEVWQEHETWITKVVAYDTAADDTVVTPPPLQAATSSKNKRPIAGGAVTPQKKSKGEADPLLADGGKKKGNVVDPKVKKSMMDAQATKRTHEQLTSKASTVLKQVDTDVLWQWCREAKMGAKLATALGKVRDIVHKQTFFTAITTKDIMVLKKASTLSTLGFATQLDTFVTAVTKPLKQLQGELEKLQGQHDLEMKARADAGLSSSQ